MAITTTELDAKAGVPAVGGSTTSSQLIAGTRWAPWLLGAIAVILVAWNIPTLGTWVRTFLDKPQIVLQWFIALLPGAIILHHLWYLLLTRRNQFRTLLAANPK